MLTEIPEGVRQERSMCIQRSFGKLGNSRWQCPCTNIKYECICAKIIESVHLGTVAGLKWPFCSAEPNHFSNFGKGALEEHFSKIILKSGPFA